MPSKAEARSSAVALFDRAGDTAEWSIPKEAVPLRTRDPTMPDTSPSEADPALALVHEGWDHLRRQRPVAAWASWQRALRVEPGQKAATHALDVLANAGDLPEAARSDRKFLTPRGEGSRARWDAEFRGRDLGELGVAAVAFAALADADPADGRARFNEGLCLAWIGRNGEAVAALGLAVDALAAEEFDLAVDTWTLAEVLRQGAGAEALADDLNHVATLAWSPGDDPSAFLDSRPDVRPIPAPIDPVTGMPRLSDARLFEWLDRPPLPEPGPEFATFADVRRVRATAIRLPRSLRLSGTDPYLLEEVRAEADRIAGPGASATRREVSPLPLAFLDAAVWAIRMPPGITPDDEDRLNRAAVERYYEETWIRRPRRGLDGRSPVAMAAMATAGDPVARAKLSAVVRVREQLGSRPTTARLYQGYPFDRLRRRLGLPPTVPEAIDPSDPASMSGEELDRLDPGPLDDFALAEAYESAAALGDDARAARFAAVLAGRDPSALARLDRPALFATLVRHALASDEPDLALAHLDRAEAVDSALDGGRGRRRYRIWQAELNARAGRPDASALVYRDLLDEQPDPALALDAAETLLDNDHDDHARALARVALDLATGAGDRAVAARAEGFLL